MNPARQTTVESSILAEKTVYGKNLLEELHKFCAKIFNVTEWKCTKPSQICYCILVSGAMFSLKGSLFISLVEHSQLKQKTKLIWESTC